MIKCQTNYQYWAGSHKDPCSALSSCLHERLARRHNVNQLRLCRWLQSHWRESGYIEHRCQTNLQMVFRQLHVNEPCEKQICRDKRLCYSVPDQLHFRKSWANERPRSFFLKTFHGHIMLRKEQRQLSKPFTLFNESYQKLHLSIEQLHMSLLLSQSSAAHRPYGCPT